MKISQNHTSPIDKAYYLSRTILVISLPTLIVSTLLLSLPHSFADNSSADNLTISVPSSCTLNATINSEHSISTIGGTYIDDIGTTTLKTICNDANGFSIYTIGSSNSLEGNTNLISSVSSDYNIATGTATSGNISNWAMKLTPVSGTYTPNMTEGYNNQYVAVPNTWTKVASRPSNTDISADSSVAGSSLTTTYAAYISSAQPAGIYTGQVKYVLLHPNTNANFMTLEMAFDHYVGSEYKISLDGSSTGPKYYRMQDMTSEICQAATVMGGGAQMQLIDDRINLDGNKRLYWVAKLADGNCWMTQNLDLDLIAGHTYTHADTDLGWDPSSPNLDAFWVVDEGHSTILWNPVAGKFIGWSDQTASPYSADPGEKYYYNSGSTANDIEYNSLQDCINAGHTDCDHYHTGNYYNWTAAVANNVVNSGYAPGSVCPRGWRLPKTSENEFTNLLVEYNVIANTVSTAYVIDSNNMKIGFNNIRNHPLYFARSGNVHGGTLGAVGYGLYWSNNAKNYNDANSLNFNSDNIGSVYDYDNKRNGRSLRCLAR